MVQCQKRQIKREKIVSKINTKRHFLLVVVRFDTCQASLLEFITCSGGSSENQCGTLHHWHGMLFA